MERVVLSETPVLKLFNRMKERGGALPIAEMGTLEQLSACELVSKELAERTRTGYRLTKMADLVQVVGPDGAMESPIPGLKVNVQTVTRETAEWVIDRNVLLQLMRASGVEVPKGASITFHVPGGGDYSNMDLDIDAEHPVVVRWSR